MRVSSISIAAVVLAAAGQSASLPKRASEESSHRRAEEIKEVFQIAWDGYYKHAFPHDQLHPVDNGYDDSLYVKTSPFHSECCGGGLTHAACLHRGGWGASAVDALSTAVIMGKEKIVHQILDYIPTIDFSHSVAEDVSLFETTIRFLGGLLSGYDLLTGPGAHFVKGRKDKEKVEAILEQAKNLADALKYAFDTESGIPHNILKLNSTGTDGATTNGLATTGTLVLEWTHLSDLTGDDEYARLAQRTESHLLDPKPEWAEPFPGLVGSNIDIKTGEFVDALVHWNGGDDSFYEYLIKMWVYDPKRFARYKDRWIKAAESTMKHLTSYPEGHQDLYFVDIYNGTDRTRQHDSQHLTGFIGGNYLLGGSVLGRQDLIDYGLKLVDSWHHTYASTATKIGPETFSWDSESVPEDQKAFFQKYGFWLKNPVYILRPEVVESYYYAYRVTGNKKVPRLLPFVSQGLLTDRILQYRDWAWDAFRQIKDITRVGSGYSAINDVNDPKGGGFRNSQESFFFAEVLKYLYLINVDGK